MSSQNLKLNSEISKYKWLIVYLGFLPYTFWTGRTTLSLIKANFLDANSPKQVFFDSSLITKIFSLGLEVSFPVITITFLELIFRKLESRSDITETSISKLRKSKGFPFADIFYHVTYYFISNVPIILTILTFGIINANDKLNGQLKEFIDPISQSSNIFVYGTVTSLLLIFLKDGAKYISHRFQHQNQFFWDLHEFHHSATEMTVFSHLRHLPFEELPYTILSSPISILYGLNLSYVISQGSYMPIYIHFIYSTHVLFFNWCGHSSLKVIYPKPLNKIFMSPALHWFHHSSNNKHFDSNFSSVFTFWDKIGGTYIGEERLNEIESYGVQGSEYNKFNPFYIMFILPYVKISKRIKNCIRSKNIKPVTEWYSIEYN